MQFWYCTENQFLGSDSTQESTWLFNSNATSFARTSVWQAVYGSSEKQNTWGQTTFIAPNLNQPLWKWSRWASGLHTHLPMSPPACWQSNHCLKAWSSQQTTARIKHRSRGRCNSKLWFKFPISSLWSCQGSRDSLSNMQTKSHTLGLGKRVIEDSLSYEEMTAFLVICLEKWQSHLETKADSDTSVDYISMSSLIKISHSKPI